MASVSIPDPSVRRPNKIRSGATEGETRATLIGITLAIAFFGLFTLSVYISFKSLTIEQVNIAMPLIIQLDSFLTAGWIVGFFYFWSELEKALTASKLARRALKSRDPSRAFDTAERAILHQSMQSREKELTPTFGLFAEIVFGAVMFIISGIFAVFAIFTYAILIVELALEFMVGGVLVMIVTWIALRYITQKLRELSDIAVSEVEG